MAAAVDRTTLVRESYALARFNAERLGHDLRPFRAPTNWRATGTYWASFRITTCRRCGLSAHVDLTKQGADRLGGLTLDRTCTG